VTLSKVRLKITEIAADKNFIIYIKENGTSQIKVSLVSRWANININAL
jgi:hypothetical protein